MKVKVNMKLLNHKSRAGDCFECEFYVWFVRVNWVCGSKLGLWEYEMEMEVRDSGDGMTE